MPRNIIEGGIELPDDTIEIDALEGLTAREIRARAVKRFGADIVTGMSISELRNLLAD